VGTVIDTNVLVYAHREDVAEHARAAERLRVLATSGSPLGLPWPCVYEFLRVVTHARVLLSPSRLADAWKFVTDVAEIPSVTLLSETSRHAEVLARLLDAAQPTGNLVHDAHVAALALEHGFDEVLTQDRDFRRFPGIRIVGLDGVRAG